MSKLDTLLQIWNSKQPFPEQLQSRLDRKFTLEFNYNSNHIEGNQLTYGQTEILLLFGKVVSEANIRDLEEMKSHDVALKLMISEA
jgi:Fic family protein